jgi:hypothetical protein
MQKIQPIKMPMFAQKSLQIQAKISELKGWFVKWAAVAAFAKH